MPQAKKPHGQTVGATQGFAYYNSDKSAAIKTTAEAQEILDIYTKASLAMFSLDTIPISDDPDDCSFVTGLIAAVTPIDGFAIADVATGAISNNSTRTYKLCSGTVSIQPSQQGGGTDKLTIFSEYSDDNGATWTVNQYSKRGIRANSAEESFSTKVSIATNWIPGRWIRFRMVTDGSITINPISETVQGGQTITAPSFAWELSEA